MDQSQSKNIALSKSAIFMQQVYSWMFLGLLFTALVAYVISSSQALMSIFVTNTFIMIALIVAMLGLAFYIPSRIGTFSAAKASGLFMLFAGINGAMLSPILLIYTQSSIFVTFLITAAMFGSLALYGMVTKRDLTAMGQFMMMGLIGIILASLANIFFQSSSMQFVINVLGVIIFAGLTAYDNQKIKQMGESAPIDDALAIRRGAILGALTLYLDFINLFLMLLRLFGQTRD